MYVWSKFSLSHPTSHQLKSHSPSLWGGEKKAAGSKTPLPSIPGVAFSGECSWFPSIYAILHIIPQILSKISIYSLFNFNPVWSLVQDILYGVTRQATFVAHTASSFPEETLHHSTCIFKCTIKLRTTLTALHMSLCIHMPVKVKEAKRTQWLWGVKKVSFTNTWQLPA